VTGDELRQGFLSFFQDRGHKVVPGSSLVPHKDPTLLLTSAGMVQIKPYYLGLETPPGRRLASCQKCFRTTDIDSVGDSKHLTFFEMLGNFSVGDYFKKETISWAWEFVTKYLRLPEERLWITIYLDDEESFTHWRGLGVPADRILRFGDEDNFWGPVGDSGPCGPCSEIHYDLGEESGCDRAECGPNCDCGRFSEIWNLVFTQYNQDQDGRRTTLPKPNIDTGMGLERTLAAIQGKSSPYETEFFSALVNRVCSLSGKEYGRDENIDRAIRVVAEHSRGIAFLIADGVIPSNERRGYVLRRILRRASLFGKKLGLSDPFLTEMTGLVTNTMGHIYPELVASKNLITEVTRVEEGKFISTLDTGLSLVERLIREASSQVRKELTGEEVFRLYDTYGFPAELTAEIVKEKGLSVDWEGFQAEMRRQRERGRAAHRVNVRVDLKVGASVAHRRVRGKTKFIGSTLRHRSIVVSLLPEAKASESQVDSVSEGQNVGVILRETPFYGEMGGQVGDAGEIRGERGRILVTDTVRHSVKGKELVIHLGNVVQGQMSVGDVVDAEVDGRRRWDIARNHTATHLLQAALRQTLGSRVYQKGSLVEPERFRFDFSHLTPIAGGELTEIQRRVNGWIRQNLAVQAKTLTYAEAVADGAIALFEEKYGERVRMLTIGKPAISKELCGGTHVKSTGQLGIFLITSESSIGTGLHRIEGLTGREAESLIESRSAALQHVANEVASSVEEVPDKVRALINELEAERKKGLWLERELSRKITEDLARRAEQVGGVTMLVARVPSLTMHILREMGDILRDRLGSAVVVLGTVYNGKPGFVAMVTPDLVTRGINAGDIVNQVAKVAGGGGGGKAGMAQAGGKDASKVDEALEVARRIIASQVSSQR
jgi:alanyl-tRNA synthetase